MVKLKVDTYCDSCPDFEPYVDKHVYEDNTPSHIKTYNTYITCEHKDRCKNIFNYLKLTESEKEL